MKAYKILALLERVQKMEAGDKRVLINGFPCKVDFRIISDDLFEDAVSALKETIEELEQVKNCSIPNVVGRSEQLVCPECKSTDCKTAIHTDYKECNKCYHYWEAN